MFGGEQNSGDVFVKPNMVRVRAIDESDIGQNAVVFVPIIILWVAFVVLLYGAHRADQDSTLAVGPVSLLGDNALSHDGHYQINVQTGFRFNAGLGSENRVFIQLWGSQGRSQEIELRHKWRPLWQRGGVDSFLISVPVDIGHIKKVKIRHDSRGFAASWFLVGLDVVNLIRGERSRRYFWLDQWVAGHIDGCTIECVIHGQTLKQSSSWQRSFRSRMSHAVSDSHTVLSVFLCPRGSRFNRTQRAMILMQFVCTSLFVNALFFQADAGSDINIAQTLTTGILSALIVLLPLSLVIFLFRHANLPLPKNSKTKKNRVSPAPDASPEQPPPDLETFPELLGSTRPPAPPVALPFLRASKDSCNHSTESTQARVSQRYNGSFFGGLKRPDDAERAGAISSGSKSRSFFEQDLPSWCRELAWLVSIACCIWCCYYVLLLSFAWGPRLSRLWLVSVFTSVCMNTLVSDPLFIVLLALVGTVVMGGLQSPVHKLRVAEEVVLASDETVEQRSKEKEEKMHRVGPVGPVGTSASFLARQTKLATQDRETSLAVLEVLRYLVLYTCVIVVFMVNRDDTGFHLRAFVGNTVAVGHGVGSNLVEGRFVENSAFGSVASKANWWSWTKKSVTQMYQREWYNGNVVANAVHGHGDAAAMRNQQVYFLGSPRT